MGTIDHSPVASSKEVLGGSVVFAGTRVPVQTLMDYLNDGYSVEEFIEFFPSVRREDVETFLSLVRRGQ